MINLKHLTKFLITLTFLVVSITPVFAETFSDDFNDGNAEGWLFLTGNWWVENQELRQQHVGDDFTALVDGVDFTTQEVCSDMMFEDHGGGGGIDIWFQDFNNRVYILLYPAAGYLATIEYEEGVRTDYYHAIPDMPNPQWHNLKVRANSTTGAIDVYLDGNFEFTYTATTSLREGKTGLFNGNSPLGGHFDNFVLATPDPDDDIDGVINTEDMCPNTTADIWADGIGNNKWQVMTEPQFGWYKNETGQGESTLTYYYDLSYTYGCNGSQILELTDNDAAGFLKFGLTNQLLESFHMTYFQ